MSELQSMEHALSDDDRREHLVDLLEDFVRQRGGYAHALELASDKLLARGTADEFWDALSHGEATNKFTTAPNAEAGNIIKVVGT